MIVRYPRQEDLDDMLAYINELSREDTFLSVLGKKFSREEEKEFLTDTLKNIQKGRTRHFAVFVHGAYAGNCEIVRYIETRQQHVGTVGISLASSYRDEGIGSELFKLLIQQAKDMGLRLLVLTCFENNPRALHVYEKLGFKKTGVIPGKIAYKDTLVGEVQMYLTLEEG